MSCHETLLFILKKVFLDRSTTINQGLAVLCLFLLSFLKLGQLCCRHLSLRSNHYFHVAVKTHILLFLTLSFRLLLRPRGTRYYILCNNILQSPGGLKWTAIGEVVRCILFLIWGSSPRIILYVSDLDKICPATLLHDSVTLVEVFGIFWTKVGEAVSAQQAADMPQVLARVIHFTLVLRSFGTSLIIYDEI